MEMLERRDSPESSCSDVVTRSDLSVGLSARYYLLLTFAGKSLSVEPESRDPLPTSHITRRAAGYRIIICRPVKG